MGFAQFTRRRFLTALAAVYVGDRAVVAPPSERERQTQILETLGKLAPLVAEREAPESLEPTAPNPPTLVAPESLEPTAPRSLPASVEKTPEPGPGEPVAPALPDFEPAIQTAE